MGYPDLAEIHLDVEKGLASQRHRLDSAAMASAFWNYDAKSLPVFLREAETPFDYQLRPYRMSGLCRQIVEVLCEHLGHCRPHR